MYLRDLDIAMEEDVPALNDASVELGVRIGGRKGWAGNLCGWGEKDELNSNNPNHVRTRNARQGDHL